MSTKNSSDFPAALNEPLIFELEKISPQIISSLVSVWYESVKATHSFLSESEIGRIMEYVPEVISSVEHLVVVSWGGTFVAFMGVTGRRLEMLFIHPDFMKKGLGRKLVEIAIACFSASELTVNEQNPEAIGFYRHMGFTTYKRTELDEEGNPYPLLYMKR